MIWIPQPLTIAFVGRYLEYQDIYLPTTKKYVQLVKNHYPFIRPVICASGDKFIADETKKRALNHDFKADICDMEGDIKETIKQTEEYIKELDK